LAEAPKLPWVADITYIPTWAGFLYLGVVLDAYGRRIVGWSMATTPARQLVLDALNMALATRRRRGVIHQSDQGSQDTSIEFGQRWRKAGVRPLMGSVGGAYDNAMCKRFFAILVRVPINSAGDPAVMSAGAASALGRHNLFMVQVFGSSRDLQRCRRDAPGYSRSGWIGARQLSSDEPAEADAYSLFSRPSTTCVARSVAVDCITR
jgi:transposase InsO family protein